jgi:hypothetical protein
MDAKRRKEELAARTCYEAAVKEVWLSCMYVCVQASIMLVCSRHR